jgi:serine phosphatase RsbU (regulator of sigma subunit)
MLKSFKIFFTKNKIKIAVGVTALFLLLSAINYIFIFNITAQSNDECLWTQKKDPSRDSTTILIEQVKVGGVTWNAGIRDGDELIAIDGRRTKNTFIATQILDKVQKGDYATYTVRRGEVLFETPVLVKKLINFSGLAINLLATFWLIVGFIVFMARPEGKIQRLFFKIGLMFVLLGTSSMLYRGGVVDNPIFKIPYLYLLVDNIAVLGVILITFMLIHFFSIFPKEFMYVSRKWFPKAIYIIAASIFLLGLIIKIFFWYVKGNLSVYILMNQIGGVMILVSFICGFVLLWINYTRLKSKKERLPIFVILIAYFIGIAAIIYTNFIASAVAGLIFNNPAFFMPIILIALLPIAFGYSIFRYSLMDVSIVIKNAIVYGTATAALAGLYFLLIYIIGQSIGSVLSDEYQGIIAGLIFVLFAVVFQSTKDKFQDLLTQKFYPEQFLLQKSLLRFSNEVASIVGIENIMDSTQQLYVKSLKLKKFGLMLFHNHNGNHYRIVRQEGFYNSNLKIFDETGEIQKYFLNQIMIGKKPLIEQQDFKSNVESKFAVLLEEEIYTVVPMIIKSKVIGLLLFGLKYSGSQFSGKDLDLLISAASQTALSLENARLYESEAVKQKIERDLENARIIQEGLIPKNFPKLSGMEVYGQMIPAMQVGGDYFDLIKLSDKKMFIVIGDVSGKGLSASLYMSKLQTMMKLYCRDGVAPKEILIEINSKMYEEIEKNWFITISLALIDLEKREFIYCRAGHTPLLKFNNNLYEIYRPSGIGIGLDKGELFDTSLEEIVIKINKDDLYFFFSDGVTELMNEQDELFGIDTLKLFMSEHKNETAKLIGNQLMNRLNSFRGEKVQYDDITFVLLKIL